MGQVGQVIWKINKWTLGHENIQCVYSQTHTVLLQWYVLYVFHAFASDDFSPSMYATLSHCEALSYGTWFSSHACAWLICSLGLKHIVTVFLICRNWNQRGIRMKRKMSEERKESSFDSGMTHTSSTHEYQFKTQMHTAFRPPFLVSSQILWNGGCYAFQMIFWHRCQHYTLRYCKYLP